MATENKAVQTRKTMIDKLDEADHGLWLRGIVQSRRRRRIPLKDSDKVRYVIVLRILADGEIINVDRWSDSPQPSDIPERGADFNQKVFLRIFNSKGGTRVSLQWGENADEGEF